MDSKGHVVRRGRLSVPDGNATGYLTHSGYDTKGACQNVGMLRAGMRTGCQEITSEMRLEACLYFTVESEKKLFSWKSSDKWWKVNLAHEIPCLQLKLLIYFIFKQSVEDNCPRACYS